MGSLRDISRAHRCRHQSTEVAGSPGEVRALDNGIGSEHRHRCSSSSSARVLSNYQQTEDFASSSDGVDTCGAEGKRSHMPISGENYR
jgi:hypothetical protein